MGRALLVGWAVLVFLFLVLPILAVLPLAFNGGAFLNYPLEGVSLRWFAAFFGNGRWTRALLNSLAVGLAATALAVVLGTLVVFGLDRTGPWLRRIMSALALLPMIIPSIIVAVALQFVMAPWRLTNTYLGVILGHALLGLPFVVVNVAAALAGFDRRLAQAASGLGATPFAVFRTVTVPQILPGLLTGALFAFATSFDEVVVTLFLAGPDQTTLPRQMFSGLRENIDPTIAAAASIMILVAAAMLLLAQRLGRKDLH
jgi:putative spermidine/putrescine transport system permease protein